MRVEGHGLMRWRRWLALLLGSIPLAAIAGCATNALSMTNGEWSVVPLIARVTNLSEAVCRDSFKQQVASALVKQGEAKDTAVAMSIDTASALSYRKKPDMFFAFSPSGLRYGFFVQNRKEGCILRMYERQKKILGSTATLENGVNYFATGRLTGCACSRNELSPDED